MSDWRVPFAVFTVITARMNLFTANADTENPKETDESKAVDLSEIVVTGGKSINKGEYVMLFLSKENENFGVDALDAVSSLNRFSITVNASTLKSNQGKEVFILIDGVPSTADVLKGLKGSDIKRVDYYDTPPARYRNLTSNPIANIILRKRPEYLLSGNLQAMSNLNSILTNEKGSLLYRDSLNSARISYDYYFQDLHHNEISTTYDYPDIGTTSESGKDKRNKNITHKASVMYQRFQGKHLFNTQFSMQWASYDYETPYSVRFTDKATGTASVGNSNTGSKTKPTTYNLDLYYNYDIAANRHIYVDLLTSYSRSKKSSFYEQLLSYAEPVQISTPERAAEEDFLSESYDDIHTYSLNVHAGYTQPLLKGTFSASLSDLFTGMKNNFSTNTTSPQELSSTQNKLQGNAGISWYKNFWYISPSVGATYFHNKYGTSRQNKVSPYAYLTMQLNGQGRAQGLYLTLRSYIVNNDPRIGNTVAGYNYIDRYLVSAGNTNLKSSTYNETSVNLQYYTRDGRNFVSLYVANQHTWNATARVIAEDSGLILSQLQNIGHANNVFAQLYGRWNPLQWLYVTPNLQAIYYRHHTPLSHISKGSWAAGLNIMGVWREWYLTFALDKTRDNVNGDFTYSQKLSFGGSLTWVHKGWSITGSWYNSGKTKTECLTPIFSMHTESIDRSMRNYLNLSISYNFSKGRARQHADKSVSLSSGDNGLRD